MNQEKIKQVTTKNPKRVEASKKSYEERMLKMKKDILENAGSNDGSNESLSSNDGSNDGSNESLSSNDGGTIGIKSNNDVYFYGIGLSILVL